MELKEIKTVGDVWAVYDAAGITRPHISRNLMFENARALKKLLDRITELEAQRDELVAFFKDTVTFPAECRKHSILLQQLIEGIRDE